MKKYIALFLVSIMGVLPCTASDNNSSKENSQASDTTLLTFEQALANAVFELEAKIPEGTEIVIAKIDAPSADIGDFLSRELTYNIISSGKLVMLEPRKALEMVNTEYVLQISGMIDDKSAADIGNFLGAKVVITGAFSRYANLSQLRLRAVDAETSALIAAYCGRLQNDDPVIAEITQTHENVYLPLMTERVLENLNKGRDYLYENRYDEAIRAFTLALVNRSDLQEGFFYRGMACFKKGSYARAISNYNMALKINPANVFVLFNRGLAHFYRGDNNRAVANYNAVLKIDPNNAEALSNRGLAYAKRGDHNRAIADYNAALRINPDNITILTNRGNAYKDTDNYDRAMTDFNSALKINSAYAKALFCRGTVHHVRGNYTNAIADFDAALKIDPDYADALYARGTAYSNKGDYNRAEADFNAALKVNPNHSGAKRSRGLY
ncbi:MAG: tetratricopeptide repeat protein [Chitinispirillales bacterium]|jgi:tetratricopeptide (TPR) repeat protein|nr:tetratricopeptide repeat protein [Chitinispirillales bacterium]